MSFESPAAAAAGVGCMRRPESRKGGQRVPLANAKPGKADDEEEEEEEREEGRMEREEKEERAVAAAMAMLPTGDQKGRSFAG